MRMRPPEPFTAPDPPPTVEEPVERLSLVEARENLKWATVIVRLLRQEPPGVFSSLYRKACQSRQKALDAYRVALALDDTPRQRRLL
jgi:hypothetical protein